MCLNWKVEAMWSATGALKQPAYSIEAARSVARRAVYTHLARAKEVDQDAIKEARRLAAYAICIQCPVAVNVELTN